MAGKAAGPCVFVLFGAAGDLTKRKLIPALFNLVQAKLLPEDFAVMGVSVDDLSVDAFRDQVSEFLPSARPGGPELAAGPALLRARRLRRSQHVREASGTPGQIDVERHTQGNYLFYMATAPKFFAPIVQQLGRAGLSCAGRRDTGGESSSKNLSARILSLPRR